jgi:hypothetical protein
MRTKFWPVIPLLVIVMLTTPTKVIARGSLFDLAEHGSLPLARIWRYAPHRGSGRGPGATSLQR